MPISDVDRERTRLLIQIGLAAVLTSVFSRFMGDPVTDWNFVLAALAPFIPIAISAYFGMGTRLEDGSRFLAIGSALLYFVLWLYCHAAGPDVLQDHGEELLILVFALPLQIGGFLVALGMAIFDRRG